MSIDSYNTRLQYVAELVAEIGRLRGEMIVAIAERDALRAALAQLLAPATDVALNARGEMILTTLVSS